MTFEQAVHAALGELNNPALTQRQIETVRAAVGALKRR